MDDVSLRKLSLLIELLEGQRDSFARAIGHLEAMRAAVEHAERSVEALAAAHRAAAPRPGSPVGCACPAGAEATGRGAPCPRRPVGSGGA